MLKIAVLVASFALAVAPAAADPQPLMLDAMGPLVDVTDDWERYQPAASFCVELDGFDGYTAFSGDAGPVCEGSDDLLVEIDTPPLCELCRRLFIDYAEIPEANQPGAGLFWARGHVYFRLHAPNPTHTVNPIAHSPNIKNLTNDKFVSPEGSVPEQVWTQVDTHAIAYVGSTGRHTHSEIQGPYYVGPTYVNTDGQTVRGAYLDLLAGPALGDAALDSVRYWVGYNAGEATCPDNVLFDGDYADGNYGYGGCAAHPAISESAVWPYEVGPA